jgi:hypothetical protein
MEKSMDYVDASLYPIIFAKGLTFVFFSFYYDIKINAQPPSFSFVELPFVIVPVLLYIGAINGINLSLYL